MFNKRNRAEQKPGDIASRSSAAHPTEKNEANPAAHSASSFSYPLSPGDVLMLQRTIGNHATQNLIQRLSLEKYKGKGELFPKKKKSPLKLLSPNLRKEYSRLYKLIEQCHTFASETTADFSTLMIIHRLYQQVIDSARTLFNNLDKANEGEKESASENPASSLLEGLIHEATLEQSVLRSAGSGGDIGGQRINWYHAIDEAKNTKRIYRNQITDQKGGALNEVLLIGEGGVNGYFKRNIEKIPHFLLSVKNCQNDPSALQEVLTTYGFPIRANYESLETLLEQASFAGIIPQDLWTKFIYNPEPENASAFSESYGLDAPANMARREVAMSRLNELLGAGVIAHAEMAILDLGGEQISGSLMAKAQGASALSIREGKTGRHMDPRDPNLVRLLSRLQLLDVLAHQIDRHSDNYFVELDESGRVISITGIDSDMSFGLDESIEKGGGHFRSVSLFVDAELAHAILSLDPELLGFVMEDLLTPSEIAALLIRLMKLKALLAEKAAQGELLERDQWGDEHINTLLAQNPRVDANTSYYSMDFGEMAAGQRAKQGSTSTRDTGEQGGAWSRSAEGEKERKVRGNYLGARQIEPDRDDTGKGKEKETTWSRSGEREKERKARGNYFGVRQIEPDTDDTGKGKEKENDKRKDDEKENESD